MLSRTKFLFVPDSAIDCDVKSRRRQQKDFVATGYTAEEFSELMKERKKILWIVNKCDVIPATETKEIRYILRDEEDYRSWKLGENWLIDELTEKDLNAKDINPFSFGEMQKVRFDFQFAIKSKVSARGFKVLRGV